MSRRSRRIMSNQTFRQNEDSSFEETTIKIENSLEDDPNVAELVLSNKGGPKVIHNGYMYTLHKKQPYNIRWRCVGRSLHCRGSLITTADCKKPRVRIEHNHRPDLNAAQIARRKYLALGQPRVFQDGKVRGSFISSFNTLEENAFPDAQFNSTTVEESSQLAIRSEPERATSVTVDRKKLTPYSRSKPIAITSTKREKLENVEMKQEPEDDEDCFMEENMPQSSPGNTGRVRSHARSLRAMANPSAVWAHFDLCANDPLRAQCRICGAVVVRGGANPRQCGTTNLHRHLRVHHGGRLIGKRYHVLQSQPRDNSTIKAIRVAAQSFMKQMRNIAPSQQSSQQTSQQSQQQRQPKTLVLKTIPLKVKQVAPTTIKMPPRQTAQGIQGTPQNVLPQQPTEVCLRWNSYHSNMQSSFPSLLDSEEFVDVTLACEGRSLKCHKMILSSCSDYLAALLRENPCQHPIILMKDLKFWEVEALVKFMYRGEVNVAHDKLPQLLNAAEALQVKGLAGPSPSSQNPKPPLLIPQSKAPVLQPLTSRVSSETKENSKASTSSATSAPSSPKRGHKRQVSESAESTSFTKIRLQRPRTPGSPNATVKSEPLDIPLSPTEMFPDEENNEDNSNPATNFGTLMNIHEDDDPGGDDERDSADREEMNFCEITGPPDLNDSEDQMEFVPTDFLDQEQDIVEEQDASCNLDEKDKIDENENEEEDEDVPEEQPPSSEKENSHKGVTT